MRWLSLRRGVRDVPLHSSGWRGARRHTCPIRTVLRKAGSNGVISGIWQEALRPITGLRVVSIVTEQYIVWLHRTQRPKHVSDMLVGS
jgi:hypothetical protein